MVFIFIYQKLLFETCVSTDPHWIWNEIEAHTHTYTQCNTHTTELGETFFSVIPLRTYTIVYTCRTYRTWNYDFQHFTIYSDGQLLCTSKWFISWVIFFTFKFDETFRWYFRSLENRSLFSIAAWLPKLIYYRGYNPQRNHRKTQKSANEVFCLIGSFEILKWIVSSSKKPYNCVEGKHNCNRGRYMFNKHCVWLR